MQRLCNGINIANAGGGLTPIGDPPFFLGFLQGVPFWWTAQNCWPTWAVAVGLLQSINLGAVFFGAATDIGNGQNFMVKSIAEQRGVRVPSFLEFVWKF